MIDGNTKVGYGLPFCATDVGAGSYGVSFELRGQVIGAASINVGPSGRGAVEGGGTRTTAAHDLLIRPELRHARDLASETDGFKVCCSDPRAVSARRQGR